MKEEKVAIYLRLSREDDEREKESESIASQRALLKRYAASHGWVVAAEFADDGFSGTRFDRPGFQKMLMAVEKKEISIILTKDLSRLGRDYIQTGYYMERYFPEKGIRYIAVNDGIDTFLQGAANDMAPFQSVFNDFYAKDISKKVRTSLEIRRREGKFLGAFAPFGYKKSQMQTGKLIPQEDCAKWVYEIFRLSLLGFTSLEISSFLSENRVQTPQSRQTGRLNFCWNCRTVERILKNPVYIGTLVQGKTARISYKVSRRRSKPAKEWAVCPHTHQAIVSKDVFDAAQRCGGKGKKHLLSGFLICASCRSPMTFSGGYAVCSKRQCNSCGTSINEKILESMVCQCIFNVLNFVGETLPQSLTILQKRMILSFFLQKVEVDSNKNIEVFFRFLKPGMEKQCESDIMNP